MARSALAGLVFALGLAAQSPQLKQAGVCSRCHVAQVLEWSVAARHVSVGTTCQSCHGPSAAHVANERNQVKPDRPTPVCQTCHAQGCPKTQKTADCQSCHHPHALSNPNDRQLRQSAAPPDPAAETYKAKMAEGERLASAGDWIRARAAFGAAKSARPADRRAASRLQMAERRSSPPPAGLEVVGRDYDPDSGYPLRVRVQGTNIEMQLVRGGETDIGSDDWPSSRPVHSVHTEPFYLGKTEVTQQQWSALGVPNPSSAVGANLPVHNVSWEEVQAWIARLNAKTGGRFRLPTEAEWERAARPGDGAIDTQAWYRNNTATAPAAPFRESGAYSPREVATKRPNAQGFFDMQGNVAEWCQSAFRPYPYEAADGRESGAGPLRVVRGGAYADSADYLNPAFRHSERPGRRSPWIGFRLAW